VFNSCCHFSCYLLLLLLLVLCCLSLLLLLLLLVVVVVGAECWCRVLVPSVGAKCWCRVLVLSVGAGWCIGCALAVYHSKTQDFFFFFFFFQSKIQSWRQCWTSSLLLVITVNVIELFVDQHV